MGFVYFSIPCFLGVFIMNWTSKIAEKNFEAQRSRLSSTTVATIEQNAAFQAILNKHNPNNPKK